MNIQSLVIRLALVAIFASGAPNAHSQVIYYHVDALGSPIAASDSTGNLVWRARYTPYGYKETYDPANPSLPIATDNNRWFTAHEEDFDTGLTYMQARYYDPVVGRFLSVDLVGFLEANPTSFNRYAYANNNPYKFVDPDGNLPNFVFGAVIGGGVEIVAQLAGNGFSVSSLDVSDIAVAAAVGAATGGASAIFAKSATTGAISAASAVRKSAAVGGAASGAGSVAGDLANGNEVSVSKAVVSATLGAAGAGAGAKVANSGAAQLESFASKSVNKPEGVLINVAERTTEVLSATGSATGVSLSGLATDSAVTITQEIAKQAVVEDDSL